MFQIKSEPSDTLDVDKDSQRIRLMDDNPNISDTFIINTSENRHDESLSEEMLLTSAYVKTKSTSNALDYNSSDSNRNESIHGEHFIDKRVIKTEKIEAYPDNTSGYVLDEENGPMQVKEGSQHYHVEEFGVGHMTDISPHGRCRDEENDPMQIKEESQPFHIEDNIYHMTYLSPYYRVENEKPGTMQVQEESKHGFTKEHGFHHATDTSIHDSFGESDAIDVGYICSSSATQSTYTTHECFRIRVHSKEKHFKCDFCDHVVQQRLGLYRDINLYTQG